MKFLEGEDECGWKRFTRLSDLCDPRRGFLLNDTLVIEAQVSTHTTQKRRAATGKAATGKSKVMEANEHDQEDADMIKRPKTTSPSPDEQWPGSYCDTKQSCCYPTTGKPASDFGVHGLWPNYNDSTYPSNCEPSTPFDQSKVSDLITTMQKEWPTLACPSGDGVTFWSHEWDKHGTCSEHVLDQHSYFARALGFKAQTNLLQALKTAGIQPDGGSYSSSSIKSAIQSGVGYTPFVECNTEESGNSQLYQVYLCVDKSGSNLIECPVFPQG